MPTRPPHFGGDIRLRGVAELRQAIQPLCARGIRARRSIAATGPGETTCDAPAPTPPGVIAELWSTTFADQEASTGSFSCCSRTRALRDSILTRCSKAREVAPRPNTGWSRRRGTIASAPRLKPHVTNDKRRSDDQSAAGRFLATWRLHASNVPSVNLSRCSRSSLARGEPISEHLTDQGVGFGSGVSLRRWG